MTGDRTGRQLSLATRRELIQAIAERYRTANRADKQKILDEFTQVTGFHRKHAIRALRQRAKQTEGEAETIESLRPGGGSGADDTMGGR